MRKLIYTIVVLIILFLLVAGYMGCLSNYEVTEQEMGPYAVAYKEYVGPYTQVASTMDEVYQALLSEEITDQVGFGIYLDNPAIVDKDKLRSEVGSIINDADIQKLSTTTEDYMVKTLPKTKSIVAEFPYKNMLSFMLAPVKMYRVLEEYMIANEIEWTEDMPAMEIYDIENNKIVFVVNVHIDEAMETPTATPSVATTTPPLELTTASSSLPLTEQATTSTSN